jgi:hypothetical protein
LLYLTNLTPDELRKVLGENENKPDKLVDIKEKSGKTIKAGKEGKIGKHAKGQVSEIKIFLYLIRLHEMHGYLNTQILSFIDSKKSCIVYSYFNLDFGINIK